MAHVAFLLFRSCATLLRAVPAALTRSEQRDARGNTRSTRGHRVVRPRTFKSASAPFAIALTFLIGLTSCQNLLRYHLLGPARDWQARSGQVLYRGPRVHLVGEVLVRYSRAGDFELTVTKGPGVPLFALRQNADFARVQG